MDGDDNQGVVGLDYLPAAETSVSPQGFDYLFRVRDIGQAQLEVAGRATADVQDALRRIIADVSERSRFTRETLGRVIDALKHREEYNVYYRDFLLGHLGDEEFADIARRMAYTANRQDPRILAARIMELLESCVSEFTNSEMSDLFRATPEDVDVAVRQMTLPLEGKNETYDTDAR